jgi:aldehyde:ferredoxin oxidoreductase
MTVMDSRDDLPPGVAWVPLWAPKALKLLWLSKDSFAAPVADKKAFMEAVRKFTKCLIDNPISGQTLPALGTASLVNIINEAGAFPAYN